MERLITVVTGASGLVGRRLIAKWDRPLIQVSRMLVGKVTAPGPWHSRAEILNGSLSGVGEVVHLEVKQHVGTPTSQDIEEFNVVNVQGTQQWLDWCERNAVHRFVYFSSIKAVCPDRRGTTSETAAGPHNSFYGASKWAAERKVEQWVQSDARRSALILRPAVIYGAGIVGNIGAMVAAISRRRFFLVGQNDNVKSLVSIENVTRAVECLIDKMQPGRCETYNLVDQESYTVREIDALIRTQFCRRGNSPTLPVAAARIAAVAGDVVYRTTRLTVPIDSSRLEALLEQTHFSCEKLMATGFVHPQSTEEGIAEMVAWYIKK